MNCICKICNYESLNNNGLGNHIRKAHNMSTQDYYNKYLKKENEGYCVVCGKPTKFITISRGYRRVCSISCGQKHPETRAKIEATNIKNYGYSTPLITKESLEKSHSKDAMIKKNETMLNRYGITSCLQTKETQDKIKQIFVSKYGVDNPAKSETIKEKTKQICLEKYGATSPLASSEIQKKIKQTNLERYGVDNPFKNPDLMKNAYTYEARLKANRTRMKNGNNSSLENYLENLFIANHIEYKPQYSLDPRYPFHCDFYLPEKDIFVEINGFWTHQDHWFDKNNENDLALLKSWKENAKIHSMYEAAIRVWTKSDVKKRKCACKNSLNYVVLWNLEDIENWKASNFEIRHNY